jgi:hypothetical protein
LYLSLSDREKFIVAVVLATGLLVIIYFKISEETWVFAVSILAVWPIAEKCYNWICNFLNSARESREPIGFLVYVAAIVLVSAIATYVAQSYVLSPFNFPNISELANLTGNVTTLSSENAVRQSINSWTVVEISAVVSCLSYVVSNVSSVEDLKTIFGLYS